MSVRGGLAESSHPPHLAPDGASKVVYGGEILSSTPSIWSALGLSRMSSLVTPLAPPPHNDGRTKIETNGSSAHNSLSPWNENVRQV